MPYNIRQAESATMRAHARFGTWLEKFMREWNQPLMDQWLVMTWASVPEQVKDELRRMSPETVELFEKRLAELQDQASEGG